MNCNECLILLDDYLESELDAKDFNLVKAHLAACANCASSYRKLEKEQNLYGQYLAPVKASPEVWTNLQMRLEKAQSSPIRQPFAYFQKLFSSNFTAHHFHPLPTAALMIVIMLSLAGFIKYKLSGSSSPAEHNYATLPENAVKQNLPTEVEITESVTDADDRSRDKQTSINRKTGLAAVENQRRKIVLSRVSPKRTNPAAISKTNDAPRQEPSDDVVRRVERQYVNAIALLTGDIKNRRDESISKNLSQAETALTELDRTIEDTRRAVREQPQNAVAVQYMTDAYAKKVELLRGVLNK